MGRVASLRRREAQAHTARKTRLFSKVLVPLDGSEVAQAILPYVTEVARSLDVPLVLHSVVDRGAGGVTGTDYDGLFAGVEAAAKTRLWAVARQLDRDGLRAEVIVTAGRPSEQIVAVAEQQGCDLIAMSTHGRNALARGILGSVTYEVVHSARIPVLAMTPDKADVYRLHDVDLARVMVPLDGSPLAETVVPYVEHLASRLSLEVLLVYVVTPVHQFWMDGPPAGIAEEQGQMEAEAAEYLQTIAKRLRAATSNVRWQVLIGHPAAAIIDLANETPHDLIAMATHGRAGLAGLALGSVTDALVRGTGDPVLIIPPGAKASRRK